MADIVAKKKQVHVCSICRHFVCFKATSIHMKALLDVGAYSRIFEQRMPMSASTDVQINLAFVAYTFTPGMLVNAKDTISASNLTRQLPMCIEKLFYACAISTNISRAS